MRLNRHTLAAALRAICIEHGTLPLSGAVEANLDGLRRGPASDDARAILRQYDTECATASNAAGWQIQPDQANHGENIVIADRAGNVIVRDPEMDPGQARRIVAAVNACEGIPIDLLEAGCFTKIEEEPLYELVPAH